MPLKLKIHLILSSLVMLVPIIAGIILWDNMPESIPIHWNVHGEVDGYGSRLFVVVGLPVLFIVIHAVSATVLTAVSAESGDKSFGGIGLLLWIVPVISVFISAFVYAASMGAPIDEAILIYPIVYIAIFLCGLVLRLYPSLKIINFPTKCVATRRFSGMVIMICSIVAIVPTVFRLFYFIIPVTVVCIAAPIIYHFVRGRKLG